MKKVYYCLILIISLSCNKNKDIFWQSKNSSQFEEKYTLESTGIRKFSIDNSTAISYIPNFQTLQYKNCKYLYFYNSYSNSISLYSLTSDSLIKSVKFKTNGPNGLIPRHTNQVMMTDLDSTFVYDRAKQAFKIFDGNKRIKRISLSQLKPKDSLFFLPIWQPSLIENFYVNGEYIYISIHQYLSYHNIGDKKLHNALRINYNNDSAESFVPVPRLYKNGNWGPRSAVKTHFFLTPLENNQFFYSFASDPFIYQYNGTRFKNKFFLGSKEFKKILPLKRKRKNTTKEISWKYVATTPEYFKHFVEPISGFLFRISTLPVRQEDYHQGKKWPGFTIIIANKKGIKLGEKVFPKPYGWKKYDPRYFFCHKGYIYLFRKDLYNSNGNYLFFEEFKILNNERKNH